MRELSLDEMDKVTGGTRQPMITVIEAPLDIPVIEPPVDILGAAFDPLTNTRKENRYEPAP